METNEHKSIELQERLNNISQLEAKPTLYINSLFLKYERPTTSRLLKELIILP